MTEANRTEEQMNETIDRVCRGVASTQEGELVRAEIERLRAELARAQAALDGAFL